MFRACARSMLLICILAAMATSATADERSNTITQKLASHTYAIPRDILDNIYKPNPSREPGPSPHRSHEPEIRLYVQWPHFVASPKTEQLEHRIAITMLSLDEHPIRSVEQTLENLAKSGYGPTLDSAEYGLTEIDHRPASGLRYFIARPDNDMSFFIRCFIREPPLIGSCQFFFPYKDTSVRAFFWWPHFKDWKNIYEETVSLLDGMRKDGG
jgi:hypothetical protein